MDADAEHVTPALLVRSQHTHEVQPLALLCWAACRYVMMRMPYYVGQAAPARCVAFAWPP